MEITASTIPGMFRERVSLSKDKIAHKYKKGGAWVDVTWGEYGKEVELIARGLISLGLKSGQKVALLSRTRVEWSYADLAIMCAGGITIPIYPSNTPEQAGYIIRDSESVLIFVEDASQLDKVKAAWKDLPVLNKAIVFEGPDEEENILSLDMLIKRGREVNVEELNKRIAAIKPDDEATYVYTSGTTGPPKGVVQTHLNHVSIVRSIISIGDVEPDDMDLFFLPLAHSFARCQQFSDIYAGITTAYAESIDKVADNIKEVSPTMMPAVPRIFEKIYTRIQTTAAEGSPLKRRIFDWAVDVGREYSLCLQNKTPIPFILGLKRAVAYQLVFKKLMEGLGGRIRFFISAGAPLSKEIAEFFHAAGILILEGYGLTESCPALTINRLEGYKFGSVGQAIPGVELKIAEDGEILGRGPNVARGYFKRPEDTKEVFYDDGWLYTGDIGYMDEDGFLFITDRKKDIIVTSGGKNIAPQNLENILKVDPLISQVMVYGDRRKYLVALITLDPEESLRIAKESGIKESSIEKLANSPKMLERVQNTVDDMNSSLPSYETIKHFTIVPEDFTQENGMLTPTLKVKRKEVSRRYQKIIDSLYE